MKMTPYLFRFLIAISIIANAKESLAAWSLQQTAIHINAGTGTVARAGIYNTLGYPTYNNTYLGNFTAGGTLQLVGGLIRSQVTSPSVACNATLYYRLYKSSQAPTAWIPVNLSTVTSVSTNVQERSNLTANINLLSGLTPSTYFLEVRWALTGHGTCGTCCTQTLNDQNGGNGFRAYFDFSMFDSFTDGNYSAAPVWSGDFANYRYVGTASSAAGSTNSRSIRLRAPSATGSQYISTPNSSWGITEQNWSFWLGVRDFGLDNSSTVAIWLYANETNLESATVDGYKLLIGDNSGGDEFRLQSVTNGVGTTILTSAAITNGITDFGVAVRVRRGLGGNWTLFTSTLPTASGGGVTAHTHAETSATVNHGSATNTLYTPSGSAFFGIVCTHTNNTNSRRNIEFDAIELRAVNPLQTQVQLASSSGSINETGGTINITVTITNPSPINATNVTISRTSGTAGRVNGFTNQTLTFPANSSASQNLNITITNNTNCDDIENITFGISAVSGGTSAIANSPSSYTLTVVDDDMEYPVFVNEDAETALLDNWTMSTTNAFMVDNTAPINGVYSMRHASTGSAGTAWASVQTDDQPFDGVTTTWRFNLSHFAIEPDHLDKFLVFLSANEANLQSATVDGYAVGINPLTSGAADIITLWRVVDGSPSIALVTSPVDWGSTLDEVGFEITRSDNGLWDLRLDIDGGFDQLISAGTATDNIYRDVSYFGLRYTYKSTTSGQLALDDCTLTQKGCKTTYYSQVSGNVDGAIWSQSISGTPSVAKSSRYANYVVQNAHAVNINTNWIGRSIDVNSGGTVSIGSTVLKIYENLNTNGSFNAGTGTVVFKGNVNQSITNNSSLTLHNLTIDNDGQNVNLSSMQDTRITGTLSMNEGNLNTNDRLILVSNINGTASIAEIKSTADISGEVTIERYIPAITNSIYGSWVGIGSALTGATIADWNDDITTTGFAGSDFPPPYTFVNIQHYDESVAGGIGQGYVPVNSTSESINADKGYMIYLESAAQTIDATGSIYKGTFDKPVNYTNNGNTADGWNLIVNQYPSQVDFNPMVTNGSGISSYYVFDAEISNYRVYNGFVSSGTAARYINSSQAFFVKANTPGSYLHYQEDYKSNQPVSFERSGEENSFFSLSIHSFNGTADESILIFNEDASSNFEWNNDSQKLESQNENAVNCAIISDDNIMLTVDTRPYSESNNSIEVFAEFPVAGEYQLTVSQINLLPAGSCLSIEDIITGEVIPLEAGQSLTTAIDEPFSGIRYLIHTSPASTISVNNPSCYGTTDGAIDIDFTAGNWHIDITSDNGYVNFAEDNFSFNDLAAGNYNIVYTPLTAGCTIGVEEVVVVDPQEESISLISSSVDECGISGNGMFSCAIATSSPYEYSLYNSDSNLIASGSSFYENISFEGLSGDVYTLTIHTGCGSITHVETLIDPNTTAADIVSDNLELVIETSGSATIEVAQDSQNATSFNWFLNGIPVTGNTQFYYTFTQGGEYELVLFAENDHCSASDTIQINVQEILSTENALAQGAISMFRNIEDWTFSYTGEDAGVSMLQLFDLSGKLILNESFILHDGNTASINSEKITDGVYIVSIMKNGSSIYTNKILKK